MKNTVLKNFAKFAPVLEPLFNIVAGLQTPILENICQWLPLIQEVMTLTKKFFIDKYGQKPCIQYLHTCKIIIYPPIFTDSGKLFVRAADAEQANFLNFYSNLKKCSPDV